MRTPALIAAIVLTSITALGQARAGAQTLTPCKIEGTQPGKTVDVLCGSIEVFENRQAAAGRKITIKFVVFPATGKVKAPDALFYIAGGPGSSAVEEAPYVAEDLARVREHRDLVFVDQRGTGGSNPLVCRLYDQKDIQSYLGHWNPPERIRECRISLEKKADLRFYTTPIAMDDLDDVRNRLGYKKIDLSGVSYGTRAVMAYVRQHGPHVRAILLQGVSPFDQFMPRDFPWDTERALDGVLDECLLDEACRAEFPDIKNEAASVLERLKKGPAEAEVNEGGKAAKVKLSRDLAGEVIRYLLYQAGSAGRIPLALHKASKGDLTSLANNAIFFRREIVDSGATGLYLSVTCTEDLPFTVAKEERDAEKTFLGPYRLTQQREACSEWPRGELPSGYSSLAASEVPALIFTGQWDPVTPPRLGERVARLLPNSLHLIVPSGGHGFGGLDGLGCLDTLVEKFIESGSAKGLDTSCVKMIRRKGFVLK